MQLYCSLPIKHETFLSRFYVMESMKDWYREGDPKKHVPKLLVGLFGGIAGATSVLGRLFR